MASESVSARERVTSLYAAREAMETEMASIAGRLSQPGAPGLKGSLVDEEGFPIPGVDLYAVRADREGTPCCATTTRRSPPSRARARACY